jgi:hypothetical protein
MLRRDWHLISVYLRVVGGQWGMMDDRRLDDIL